MQRENIIRNKNDIKSRTLNSNTARFVILELCKSRYKEKINVPGGKKSKADILTSTSPKAI